MNEGILGIETREKEITELIKRLKDICPLVEDGCLGIKDLEIYKEVCRKKFESCPRYVSLIDNGIIENYERLII